jgi:hypothetical protein
VKVEPEVVSDVEETHRAAYYGLLDELIENADIVAAASPEDRRYMEEECGFNFENFEVTRRELETQRARSVPSDPLLLKAAAKRVAGIKPIEPKPYPGQSPGLARVYVAALRCRNTLFDETIKEVRRESR